METVSAPADDQFSIAHFPWSIEAGLAESDTDGAGAGGGGGGGGGGAGFGTSTFFGQRPFALAAASFALAIASWVWQAR
jgi:hypothetical protein